MLDAVLQADALEDIDQVASALTALELDELYAVVGQHGVDFVRHGSHQRFEEASGSELGGLAVDAGEDQLRGAIHSDIEECLAVLVAQFGNVDVEVADLVILELLRLLPVCLGQTDVTPWFPPARVRVRQLCCA